MTSIKNYIFNRYLYRKVFLAITILFAISFFTPFSTILNLFLLAWGGILILKDLVKDRIIFKSKRFIPLIVFMIFYFITLIINRNLNLFENVKIFALTILQFFVIFTFDMGDNYEKVKCEMKKFNGVIINMTFVATCLSLLVYLLGIGFIINGHVVGIEGGTMLNGIYTGANTAGPLAAISIVVTLINCKICKKSRLDKFDYLNIIIQLIFLFMTNSRASLYAFLAFSIVFALFYFNDAKLKVISVVGVGIIYAIPKLVNSILYWIYKGVQSVINFLIYVYEKAKALIVNEGRTSVTEHVFENSGLLSASDVLDKIPPMGFFNGRLQLWECGVKIIKDNTLFGIGSRNVADVALTYMPIEQLPGIVGGGMHNILMQVLVSNGIFGFLALLVFIIPIIFSYVKYLITRKIRNSKSQIILLISAMLLMILVHNMAEANILYTASYMSTVFWTYLGFGLFIIDRE